MQPDLLDSHVLHQFRTRSPLTHCMTNDVVQTFTANVLLALGASPAMVIEAEEAEQFAALADALLVNVGTLTAPRAQSMRRAIESAVAAGTPWVLDPSRLARWRSAPVFASKYYPLNLRPFVATPPKSSPLPE